MFRSVGLALAGLSLVVLAACAGPVYKPKPTFNEALAAAYFERAQHELAENHYLAADLFARKGNAATRGEQVDPEVVANWNVPPHTVGELERARTRLVDVKSKVLAVDRTGRLGLARRTARAQMLFDCWLEEQEEDVQPGDIAYCKSAFDATLAQVEPYLAEGAPRPKMAFTVMPEPVMARAPAPAPAPMPAAPRSYLVFFDWDMSTLTAEALEIVRTAARNAKSVGAKVIQVIGHADRSGPDTYNMGLSNRRATAVQGELERQGVQRGTVSTQARGERDPLVPTADGVREPQNRRAEIILK